jgi:hypothetical protein
MNYYYFWFAVFVFVAYLIVTDNSVAYAVELVFKIIRFHYEKTKWWILHNPRNPIVKWFIWRRSLRIAKQLENELTK